MEKQVAQNAVGQRVLGYVARIGKVTLTGDVLRLQNRTNDTRIVLPADAVRRWKEHLLAYGNRGGGFRRGGKGKGGGKKSGLRLTGLFKTKRRGLFVGSVDELAELKTRIKKAEAESTGLVFFLWRNQEEDGPPYSLSVDVSQEQDRPKKRRPIEDDDDEDGDEEDEEKDEKDDDDDDEVPF